MIVPVSFGQNYFLEVETRNNKNEGIPTNVLTPAGSLGESLGAIPALACGMTVNNNNTNSRRVERIR